MKKRNQKKVYDEVNKAWEDHRTKTPLEKIQEADKHAYDVLKQIQNADLGKSPYKNEVGNPYKVVEFPTPYTFPDDFPKHETFPNEVFPGVKLPYPIKENSSDYPLTFDFPEEIFDYNDIQLIPKLGVLKSRKDANTEVFFGTQVWKVPILPANMSSVVNTEICTKLAENDYLYCMHRFCTDEERFDFAKNIIEKHLPLSMAFGIFDSEFKLVKKIKEELKKVTKDSYRPMIWIDVAHGYSIHMQEAIKRYKEIWPSSFIIAGNVAEKNGAKFLEAAGADAVKLGVGHGEACITRLKTGFSNFGWQLSAVKEAADELNVPIVCDGGIHEHGDIAKALVMGATVCMAGSMFSALEDSPGNVIKKDGIDYKEYFGSASAKQKKNGANQPVNVEGKCILKPLKDHDILTELKWIEEDLQSAISYAGGEDLSAFLTTRYVNTKK